MNTVGTFQSKRWGKVIVQTGNYGSASGPLAVVLLLEDGEPLANLSVNMYTPQCSRDSRDLPAGCFYAKDYGGQDEIAQEALESGMFKERDDLPEASSGFVMAPVWELVAKEQA